MQRAGCQAKSQGVPVPACPTPMQQPRQSAQSVRCLLKALNQPAPVTAALGPCHLQDLAELEAAVGQQLLPLEQLGGAARALRAFRRLLFLESSEVEGSPLLKELPRPEALHHLYSRAPPALESPHTRSGLTPSQVRQRPATPVVRPPSVLELAASASCRRLLTLPQTQPPH